MDSKSLKDITIDHLIKNLPDDCLKAIAHKYISNMNIPWVRYIGRVWDQVDDDLIEESLLDFLKQFPQFLYPSKQSRGPGLGGTKEYSDSVWYFTVKDKLYYVSTILNKDVYIYDKLLSWIKSWDLSPDSMIKFE